MRISTRQIYTQGVEAFQQQQQKLAKLQQQISTGVRLSKPSDDPAASSRVLEMEQTISLKLQYQVNIGLAEGRLLNLGCATGHPSFSTRSTKRRRATGVSLALG